MSLIVNIKNFKIKRKGYTFKTTAIFKSYGSTESITVISRSESILDTRSTFYSRIVDDKVILKDLESVADDFFKFGKYEHMEEFLKQ